MMTTGSEPAIAGAKRHGRCSERPTSSIPKDSNSWFRAFWSTGSHGAIKSLAF
jgi:hypothetical protein